MNVILDERETALYEKCTGLQDKSVQESIKPGNLAISLSKRVLHLGDVLFLDKADRELLIIERKSLADLLSSIKDGRYEEQSHRLLHSSGICPHHIIYVIEGMFSQLRSPSEKKMVYSAMTSLGIFKGCSIFRTSSVQETAEWIMATADKMGRDLAKGRVPWLPIVNNMLTLEGQGGDPETEQGPIAPYCSVVKKVKKDNITPANMGEIILCQIPGISSVSAVAIMQQFHSLSHLLDELKARPDCLDNIQCISKNTTRKLSKTVVQNVKQYLLWSPVQTQDNVQNDVCTNGGVAGLWCS